MNNKISKALLVTAGAVLFNLLFWGEKMGVNTVLYDLFILVALFSLYPGAGRSITVRWLVAAHIFCLAMVVIHNTPVSKIAFSVTLLLIAGFGEYVHRSAWFAGGSVMMNLLLAAATFTESFAQMRLRKSRSRYLSRVLRFAVFPLLLLIVFFALYSAANDAFRQLANTLSEQVQYFFSNFINLFSLQQLLFFLGGLLLSGTLLLRSNNTWFSKKETACTDALQRRKLPWKQRVQMPFYQFVLGIMGRFANGMLALKNENSTGIISLVLLNVLLLAVNSLDIYHLWFHFEYLPGEPVYKMVHEGTELLIASIVLAMMLLLFFFKGNLNFYRRNKWLKFGAYAWILQNLVLVVSVAIRDYYYIARHGLAYKRIGVLFFLVMVVVGLLTVFVKIARKRTNYYLFRVNAWAGILVLVLASAIHWDELIAAYNLKRKDTVRLDVPFLLSLSDKVLPLLESNRSALEKEQPVQQPKSPGYTELLDRRREKFTYRQQQLSWLSWNYADAITKQFYQQTINTPPPAKP